MLDISSCFLPVTGIMIQNARLKPSRISLFGGQFVAGTGHRQMLFH
jgi:hypothetical protein